MGVPAILPQSRDELRPWQREALDQTLEYAKHRLIVATPGSGKTRFALAFAAELLAARQVNRIVVVTPLMHLKKQWQKAAGQMGLALAIDVRGSREPGDHHGVCITYSQVFNEAGVQRANVLAEKTLVILDEIHHAGDGNGWGDRLLHAFGAAERVLSLSGTPFRSDNLQIPFVSYEEGKSLADYTLNYGDALRDDYVRDVYFPQYEGELTWRSNSRRDVITATFATELRDDREAAERLKTALLSDWPDEVIRSADEKLDQLRQNGHPEACGLIACMDQSHAQQIADRVRSITNTEPDVVVSDIPESHKVLEDISENRRRCRWIVSVAMVSEGVDIPNLRVGIYATNKTTEMFFRQFVGRVVRKIPDHESDPDAHVYLPADERIVEMAKAIRDERDHVLEQREEKERSKRESLERQISMFSPHSGVAIDAGVIANGSVLTTADLERARDLFRRVGIAGPVEKMAIELRRLLNEEAPSSPSREPQATPLHELRSILRKDCTRLHRRACMVHDYDYAKSNHWLNQRTGSPSIGEATVDQLKRRLHLIETVLLRGQWTP